MSELRIGVQKSRVVEERPIVIEHQRARHERRRARTARLSGVKEDDARPSRAGRASPPRAGRRRRAAQRPRPHADRSRNALPPNTRMLASANRNATTKMITDSADAVAETKILQQRAEGVQRDRLGGRARSAAGHDVDDVEDAEGVERAEEERHQQRRPEQRQRDVDELPPRPGAVHRRPLRTATDRCSAVRRAAAAPRTASSSRRRRGRAESRPRPRRRTRSAAPRPSRASSGGGEAGRALEHEAPDERRDNRRNRPRQQHGRANEPAARETPIQRQRQHQPAGELEGDRGGHEHGGVRERAPEPRDRPALRRSWPCRRRAGRATACGDRAGAATPRPSRRSERRRRVRWSPSAGSASAHAEARLVAAPRRVAGWLSGIAFMARAAPSFTFASSARIAAAASCSAARGSCWRVSARCNEICRISDSWL